MDDLLPLDYFLPLRVDEIENAYPLRSEWEVWTAGDDDTAFQVAVCADRKMAEAISHYGRELLQRAYPDLPITSPNLGAVP
jgi:hypothetical protein